MDTEHESFCPYYHQAVELIGRRWTGAILRELLAGRCRFSALRSAIPGLSDRLLSERLRELEHEGIVTRDVYPDVPVRVEYHLTEKGRDLESAVAAIGQWAESWLRSDPPDPNSARSGDTPATLAR